MLRWTGGTRVRGDFSATHRQRAAHQPHLHQQQQQPEERQKQPAAANGSRAFGTDHTNQRQPPPPLPPQDEGSSGDSPPFDRSVQNPYERRAAKGSAAFRRRWKRSSKRQPSISPHEEKMVEGDRHATITATATNNNHFQQPSITTKQKSSAQHLRGRGSRQTHDAVSADIAGLRRALAISRREMELIDRREKHHRPPSDGSAPLPLSPPNLAGDGFVVNPEEEQATPQRREDRGHRGVQPSHVTPELPVPDASPVLPMGEAHLEQSFAAWQATGVASILPHNESYNQHHYYLNDNLNDAFNGFTPQRPPHPFATHDASAHPSSLGFAVDATNTAQLVFPPTPDGPFPASGGPANLFCWPTYEGSGASNCVQRGIDGGEGAGYVPGAAPLFSTEGESNGTPFFGSDHKSEEALPCPASAPHRTTNVAEHSSGGGSCGMAERLLQLKDQFSAGKKRGGAGSVGVAGGVSLLRNNHHAKILEARWRTQHQHINTKRPMNTHNNSDYHHNKATRQPESRLEDFKTEQQDSPTLDAKRNRPENSTRTNTAAASLRPAVPVRARGQEAPTPLLFTPGLQGGSTNWKPPFDPQVSNTVRFPAFPTEEGD